MVLSGPVPAMLVRVQRGEKYLWRQTPTANPLPPGSLVCGQVMPHVVCAQTSSLRATPVCGSAAIWTEASSHPSVRRPRVGMADRTFDGRLREDVALLADSTASQIPSSTLSIATIAVPVASSRSPTSAMPTAKASAQRSQRYRCARSLNSAFCNHRNLRSAVRVITDREVQIKRTTEKEASQQGAVQGRQLPFCV